MPDLDAKQRSAVDAGPIDLFISAGAGSGKTRVLAARFAAAVLGQGDWELMEPGEIVTVTFTDKAAGELATRIRGVLAAEECVEEARRVDEAWLSTIHGMCSRILRRHAFDASLDPRFGVATEVEANSLAFEAFESVVGHLYESDEDVACLIDTYGAECVRRGVLDAHADLVSLGKQACDLGVLGDEVSGELDDQLKRLRAAWDTLQVMEGPKTVTDAARAVGEAVAFVEETLSASNGPEPGRIAGLAGLARLHAVRRLGNRDEYDSAIDDVKDAYERIGRLALQIEVAVFERAFVQVLGAFETAFVSLKRSRSLLDFDDLQTETAALFESHPEIAAWYRERFRMVMIDEFQDTNELQASIARAVADRDLCTVGDERQSIYSFRHADVEVFRSHGRAVSEHRQLDRNYRTRGELLDVTNNVFGSEAFFGEEFMRLAPGRDEWGRDPWPTGEPRAELILVARVAGVDAKAAEAEAIAGRVGELIAQGAEPGEIAVLLRAVKNRGDLVEGALRRRDIPTFAASGGDFFGSVEVAEVRALLRVVDNLRDEEALITLLAGRFGGLSEDGLVRLGWEAKATSLWEACVRAPETLGSADAALLARVVAAVHEARAWRGRRDLRSLITDACERVDYDLVLFASGPNGRRAWANVLKVARLAEEFERAAPGDIGTFLDYLATREEHAAREAHGAVASVHANAVRVMSVHAAKGLEFPIVVLGALDAGGVNAGLIDVARVGGRPLLGMQWSDGQMHGATLGSSRVCDATRALREQEAARLFYVGCTRAEQGLVMVATEKIEKEAGEGVVGSLRVALGLAAPESLTDHDVSLGSGGLVRVRVQTPTEPPPAQPTIPSTCDELPRVPPAEERPAAAPQGAPERVSYSSLAVYESCPYRFYATRVARLGSGPQSVEQIGGGRSEGGGEHSESPDARAFGTAVHAALETAEGLEPLSRADVLATLRRSGLRDDVAPRLEGAVAAFLASPLATDVRMAERVQREVPILVPVAGTLLVGSIDLLCWRGEDAHVIDYKTGAGELSAVEAETRYRFQAGCYALAARAAGAVSVRVSFIELERGSRVTRFAFDDDGLAEVERRIASSTAGMAEGDYPPRDAYDERACAECPALGGLCPVTVPGGAA